MNITATNKATGEVIDLPANSSTEIVQAWRIAQEYEKAATALKEQLKKLVPTFVGEKGVSEPVGGFMFRISNIQRMTYDKSIMRQVLDSDTYDQFLKPDKSALDKFIKENLESMGNVSTELRTTMLPDGRPYQVIKLERLDREDA